jgi:hypothetical protein
MTWKFTNKKMPLMNQEKPKVEVDPRSKKFVTVIEGLLKEHGVTDKRAIGECSHQLLKATQRFFKNLSPSDDYTVGEVAELEKKFREIMAAYGITEEEAQDEIFIGYFGALNELGAEGLIE